MSRHRRPSAQVEIDFRPRPCVYDPVQGENPDGALPGQVALPAIQTFLPPRPCACGCGKQVPAGLHFNTKLHPECAARRKAESKASSQARSR